MRIVVGVTGGIAAYKACELVSRLVKDDHEVRVVMTEAAAQFVAPLTFRALSGHAVGVSLMDEPEGPLTHVKLSHWAEALVIAPVTAHFLASMAEAHADDLIGLIYLGFRGPVLVAPAMEAEMWEHLRVQKNVQALQEDGVHVVGPRYGRMASGLEGWGRMAEPGDIVEALKDITTPKDLLDRFLVITAGPTWEHFDPVRILTNPSTGLMGVTLANQAVQRGARVVLILGPSVNMLVDPRVEVRRIVSALDMLEAVDTVIDEADVLIGSAAVSDFRPEQQLPHKAHKDQVGLAWAMTRNPDIIRTVASRYRGQKLFIGFAAETDQALAEAAAKRERKGLDAVVANRVGEGLGFGQGEHTAWLVTADGSREFPGHSKAATAHHLLDWVRDHGPGDG